MAGTVQNGFKIPVNFEVIQSSISDLQKILNGLQPNTRQWKELSHIINTMTSEASKLQAQMSMPFTSQKQFNSADKTLEKIEQAAARVSVVMGSLKFSDIKLTPEQTNEFKKFEEEIKAIEAAYKQLQESVKQQLISSGNNAKLLTGMDKDALTKDFSEIQVIVDNNVKELENKVEKQNEAFKKLQSNIAMGNRATALTTTGQGLTREALGDSIFDKYLTELASGGVKLKLGKGISKQALLTEIEEMFHLEPGQLQHLASKTLDEINKAFQDMGAKGSVNVFKGFIDRQKKALTEQPLMKETTSNLEAQLREYKALQDELQRLQTSSNMGQAGADAAAKIEAVQGRIATLQAAIANGVSANANYGNSLRQLGSSCGQVRSQLESVNAAFLRQQSIMNSFNSMKMMVTNFMGFTQVLNLTKRAIKEAASHIKELDTVMNQISIVTDMDTSDLWEQVESYSAMAQKYGASIKGAYEVSKIYYQQGLESKDVLTLTNETLKLAKISGMDYAATTDYMTTAIRGFKMEMQDASTVVDVYSNLASNTAVSQEELAVAMSKTASSMESVGATFEETSAMIATMVAVTRESATNIGSAMKSIASRYGELTKDPTALIDSEGQAMSFNKVDTALQSVGISMKTVNGQFREFTDVILELGEKWDQLESTQQRYIATQFAGNRQQSRFLALVSNVDLLKENIYNAENSEDIGTTQALKALDSLESKIEQVRVAYQQFYTTIGAETVWKGFLDGTKVVINNLNSMPKLFGKIPISAISAIMLVVNALKNVGLTALASIAKQIGPIFSNGINATKNEAKVAGEGWFNTLNQAILNKLGVAQNTGRQISMAYATGVQSGYINNGKTITQSQYDQWTGVLSGKMLSGVSEEKRFNAVANSIQKTGVLTDAGIAQIRAGGPEAIALVQALTGAVRQEGEASAQAQGRVAGFIQAHQKGLASLQYVGSALQLVALSIKSTSTGGKVLKGVLTAVAGAITLVGIAATITRDTLNTIPWVAVASAIIAVISGIVQAVDAVIHDLDNQVEAATQKAEELSEKAKTLKADYKTIDSSVKKMKELEQTRYDSEEAEREYQDALNELAETYPILIESITANGDVVLRTAEIENVLTEARQAAAEAAWEAAKAEGEKARLEQKKAKSDMHVVNDKLQDIFIEDRGLLKIGNLSSMRINGETSYDQVLQVQKYLDAIEAATEGDINPEEAIKQYEELIEYLGSNHLTLSKELSEALSPIASKAREYKSYGAAIETANRGIVTSYMNKQYGGKEDSIFTKNQGLWTFATKQLYNLGALDGTEQAFSEEKLTEYRQKALDPLDQWWSKMSTYAQSEMEKMLTESDKYSKSDVETRAKELGITFDKTNSWILDMFEDSGNYQLKLIEKSKNNLKSSNASINFQSAIKFNNAFKEVTLPEFNLLSSILDQATALEDLGIDPNEFIKEALLVYQDIVKLPAELRNQVIDQFMQNGITKEGLSRTLKFIETNDNISAAFAKVTHTDSWDHLQTLIDSSRDNLLLTVNTVTDTFKNDWEDIDKFISKLTSGFDQSSLDTVLTEAEKYGIDKDQLQSSLGFSSDGKYKLGAENIEDIYTQISTFYSQGLNGISQKVTDSFEAIKNLNFDKEAKKVLIPEQHVENFQNVLGGRFTEFFEQTADKQWRLREEKTAEELSIALKTEAENVVAGVNNFDLMLERWTTQMTMQSKWKAGDYSNFVKKDGKGLFENSEQAYTKIKELSRGRIKTSDEQNDQNLDNAVTTYTTGWSNILNDLTTFGLDYVNERLSTYEGIDWSQETDVAQDADKGIITESYISLTKIAAQNAGKTVKEINAAVGAAVTQMHKGNMQPKALADLISGGFSAEDFTSYMATYAPDKEILNYFDEKTGEFAGAFKGLFEWDKETGQIKIAAKKSLKEVNDAFIKETGKGLDENSRLYAQIIEEETKNAIADADFADEHKKNAAVLSELSKATVGSRIAVTGLSSKMIGKLKAAGFEFAGDYIEITSEGALNSLMNALTTLRADSSLDVQEQKVLEGLEKYLKPTALSGIISETVSKEAASAWAIATSAESAEAAMKALGYTWSDTANAYVQDLDESTDSIAKIQAQIDALDLGTDPQAQQKKNELQTKLNKLKSSKGGQQYTALSNIISSYQTVSDDAIKALADSLNVPLETVKQYFRANGNGTYTADISGIINDINTGILEVENGVLALLGNAIGGMLSSILSSLEDSIDGNISGKYSEMAGKALEIYTKMSEDERAIINNDFTKLVEFDKTTGQFRLTNYATSTQQQQLLDDRYSSQNAIIEAQQAFYEWLKNQDNLSSYNSTIDAVQDFINENSEYKDFESVLKTKTGGWKTLVEQGNLDIIESEIERSRNTIESSMNNHVAEMAKESLASFDFNAIFDNTENKDRNKNTLKTILTNLGIDPNTLTEEIMEKIYTDLLNGSFDELNNVLPEGTKIDNILSSDKRNAFSKAYYDALETALDELLTKDVGTYSEATNAVLATIQGSTTSERIANIQSKLDSSKFTTQAERASRAQEIAQVTGEKRAESLLELLSGGFTDDEFEQWVEENFLPEERASQSIKTDKLTKANDKYTVKSGVTAESILSDFGINITDLNYSPEYLKKIEADWSTAVASEANELNAQVRAVKQINDILSGSLGEQISVADLGLGDIDIADVVKTGNEITINSEAGRKALIEWIASKKESYQGQQQILDAINSAEQEMWSKYDHATAYDELSSGLIDRDVADTIKLTLATADEMSMSTNEFMEQFGYKWSDQYHKFYVETADQLSEVTNRIKSDQSLNQPSKNAALASIEGLKQDNDKVYQQYTKISEAFGKSLSNGDQLYQDLVSLGITDEYFQPDGDLGKKLNIGKLIKDRNKLGISDIVFKALGNNFASFYDDITGTLSKATEYALSGTQSESDKQAFIEQAASLGMEITESDFVYNDLVKGWVLDINKLAEFRDIALSQMIGKDSETVNTYGKLLTTEAAKEKIDIKSFLGSDNRNVGSLAYRALEKQLTDYYTLSDQFNEVQINAQMPTDVQAKIREYNATRGERLEKAVADDIEALNKGGAEAIAVIEKLTADDMKMSPEEIASYFKPQADRYEGYLDTISQLSMGSFVAAGDLRDILQTAEAVDANGIVINTDNMVAAYKAIYDKLSSQSATIYSTLAQRNKAYVTYLKADRQKNGDILNTLQSGGVMDLDQLESLANKYITDQDLGQINPAEYGYSINKWGQVIIDNWQTFSQKVFGEIIDTADADYIAAYKTLNEGKIQRDNQIKDMITSEVEAIKGAKVGDKIDISGTISKYGNSIFQGLNVSIVDGILKIHDAMQLPQITTRILSAAVKAGDILESELLDFIASIEDGIISGIKSATDISINGTDSFADMQSFVNKYNEIFTDSTIGMSAFYYDTLFDTFRLDNSILAKYIEAQKIELQKYGLSDEVIDAYINDQTTEIARNAISIDELLGATDTTTRNREATKLADSIQTYLDITDEVIGTKAQNRIKEQIAYYEHLDDIATTQEEASAAYQKAEELQKQLLNLTTEQIVNILYQGGEAGVEWLKKLKPDASAEEIASVYNAEINRLRTAQDELSKGVGETVSGLAADIIRTTSGFKYQEIGNGDIVIEAVGDMVEAYNILYAQMQNNAEKTTADLNSAYADLLTAEDQENIDIINTLQNGTMNYHEFGELLTKYNLNFKEFMSDITNGVERDGFGNIRIVDWDAFAKKLFNTDNLAEIANTDGYISAYKAYVDGLISLNKNTEQVIVDEIKQIENAKAGDQLNLGALWLKITDGVNKAIENVEPEWYNGNVKNLGHRIRVPGSIMQEWFPEDQFSPDDYSTIYGESFASREFMGTLENIGMTFANLTEEGEGVTDLADYVHTLFTQAANAAGGADKVTAEMIKALDSQQRNLLLNIEAYDDSLSVSQVLEKEYEKAFELHERDADASWFGHLQDRLENFGATFEDGILKIGDNANLLGIADTLSIMAEEAGLEIGNGLEEIQDSVKAVLDAISDAIIKGIKGGLTGTEKQNLIEQAQNMGIQSLDFVETKEGFKLTNESAKELYFTLNEINGLQGQIVFDELKESLIETDSHFRTIQDTTAYIIELQNELNALRSQEETPENKARIASLENELALAEKINRVRSIDSKDESFNFMDGKIPEAQNNPLNYWKNWGEAFDAMKEAGKAKGAAKNTIGYEDFYNIVTEIGRLAELSGQAVTMGDTILNNSQAAADLITAAAGALKNVDGEMKIDLSKLNIDFSSGLDQLGKQIDSQVDALADSQIAMLDSVIAVLEIIVAMEALEDVDVDKDMEIEVPEIAIKTHTGEDGLTYITDFTSQMESARRMIAEAFASSEEGKNALQQVYINTKKGSYTMEQIVSATAEQLESMGITADMYSRIFTNLFKMYKDQDYNDLTGTVQSVFDVFGKYDWGDMSLTVNSGNHMLTLTDEGTYELNFVNADYDNYRKIFKEEKGKKDEQIRKDLQEQFKQESQTSDGISIETHQKIKVLQKSVVLIDDKDSEHNGEYKAGGKYYKTLEEAVAASDLYDIGAKDIDVTGSGKTASATGKITIGKFEMDVESNQKGAIFKTKDGQTFNSQQDALDYLFTGERDKAVDHSSVEYKEWELQQGISVKPVFNVNGKAGDINKDPSLRKALTDFITNYDPSKITSSKDGKTFEIELAPGVKVTLPSEGINIEDAESVKSALREQLGIDEALKETISQGIIAAFEAMNSVDSKNLSEAATAMGDLASAGTTLSGIDFGKIAEAINSIFGGGSEGEKKSLSDFFNLDNLSDGGIFDALKTFFEEATAPELKYNGDVTVEPGEVIFESEALETAATEAGTKVGEGATTGFESAISEMPTKTESVAGSVKSHFEALVEQVKQAIDTIRAAIQSLQEKISITWTIKANDGSEDTDSLINKLFNGNLGKPSDSGGAASAGLEAPDIKIPIGIEIEALEEQMAEVEEMLNSLTKEPTKIPIEMELTTFEEQLMRVLESLEKLKEEVLIPLHLDKSTFDTAIAQVTSALEALKKPVTIPVELQLPEEGLELENVEATATYNIEKTGEEPAAVGPFDTEYKMKKTGEEPASVGPFDTDYNINIKGSIPGAVGPFDVTYNIKTNGSVPSGNGKGPAIGTVGLGDGTVSTLGKAHASGTLMGELGPELVVSNGRYFVVGQNGPEMVSLNDDAIVFNHLQTEQLLKKGMSPDRGRAVTNERNAVAFASGNVNGGPAMASASAALAALKQLRAMWQALKGASISDLAGAGGGGGGGGGGGNEDKAVDPKEWVALVERWYNLMQKIAVLEHKITHEEQLRSTLQSAWNKNGTAYAKSQVKSLNALREEMQLQEQLNISRSDYYDKRLEALRDSALGQLIDFDANGQMLFRKDLDPSKFDGFTDAMEWRTWLTGYDEDHKARFSSKEKYEKLKAAGLIPDHIYDSNGKEVTMDSDQDGKITDQEREDYYYNVTKQVFDNMDEYQEAQQSLFDSIQEGQVTFLELQEKYNELLNEMYENQMDLEDKVLDAIESLKQKEIDELQNTRDALEESVNKYITGLSDALNKEREMYENQENEETLARKRRQLGILERSGGSATDIKALQDEIKSLERDTYFDLQQQQIDAIQEASDLQIERMDQQIDIMTETLEYQKTYGLLWGEVYTVMGQSSQAIADFIAGHNPEFWEASPLHSSEMMNEYLFGAAQWEEFRKNTDSYGQALIGLYNYTINQAWEDFDKSAAATYGETYNEERKKKAREIYETEFKESNDATAAAEKARLYLTGEQIIDQRKKEITGYGKTYEVGDKSDHWEYSQINGDDANHRAHHYKDGIYTGETKKEAHTWSGESCSKCGYAKPKPKASSGGGGGGNGGGNSGDCNDACRKKCGGNCTKHCASSCWGECKNLCQGCKGECKTGCNKSSGTSNGLPKNAIGGKALTPSGNAAASGGFVSHGIYELGERGIETVLTAEQTQVLRNNILSNRPSSLISLLKTYNEGFSKMGTPFNTNPATEDNSTNIDNINLTMNVQQMSNDYDARKAGQEMMNEVMKIARKTNAANSIRR